MANDDDWRIRGQETYLEGATLIRKRYTAWSEDWDHDHCVFCWATFMDPDLSPESRKSVGQNPEILTEGYAVQGRTPDPALGAVLRRVFANRDETKVPTAGRNDYWWVCPTCVNDFAERFEWKVIESPDRSSNPGKEL